MVSDEDIGNHVFGLLNNADAVGLVEISGKLSALFLADKLGYAGEEYQNFVVAIAPTLAANLDGVSLLIRTAEIANGKDAATFGKIYRDILNEGVDGHLKNFNEKFAKSKD